MVGERQLEREMGHGAREIWGTMWAGLTRGRFFGEAFKEFLSRLGPAMHDAGKVIFYNPCMAYRLECYKDVDGFFDEAWPETQGRVSQPERGRAAGASQAGNIVDVKQRLG